LLLAVSAVQGVLAMRHSRLSINLSTHPAINIESMNHELLIMPSQPAEWLPARVVLMCEPNIETLFAILQKDSANFLAPFSLAKAREEHRHYRATLEANGVTVIDVREALKAAPPADLQRWARAAIQIVFDEALTLDEMNQLQASLQTSVESLDPQSLADIVLLRPTLHVRHNDDDVDRSVHFRTKYEITPANNAYFTRDPLITTREGCVITRLRVPVRGVENDIAECVLQSLGIKPLHRVQAPGTLEGGDFIPCGEFVLQGQGLLTNEEGVRQCLEKRVYGRVEVAVVRDPRMNMDEMHLDTYFAMLDKDLAACVDTRLAGEEEPEVDVYLPEGDDTNYTHKLARTLLFSAYLKEKGITVIPFSKHEQDNFAANGLLISPRKLIGVTRAGASFEQRLRDAGVDTHFIPFDALTGGYGGPHCSSQVLLRR
jgi:arginine deiminase